MNKLVKEELKYDGKRFKVYQRTFLNSKNKEYIRDVVEPGDAVVVMPITDNNEVVFIEQLRESIGGVQLEMPAGMIDAGEQPIDAAKRELEEETGIIAKKLEHMISIYPSSGYTSEKIHIFFAKDFSKGKMQLDSTEEILNIKHIPLEKCFEMAMNCEFKLASQNIAILMYYYKFYNK